LKLSHDFNKKLNTEFLESVLKRDIDKIQKLSSIAYELEQFDSIIELYYEQVIS
jgi:hypothetical protein